MASAAEAHDRTRDRGQTLAVLALNLFWSAFTVVGITAALFSGGCSSRTKAPVDVALDYSRALYAYDAARVHALASTRDRLAKDEVSVAANLQAPEGFALELLGELSRFVTATPINTRVTGDHATVTLKLILPNANDPLIKALAREWDEQRLQALTAAERADTRRRVNDLGRRHELPVIEGDETFELLKETAGWRLVLHWEGAIPLRLAATAPAGVPLELTVTPGRISAKAGEAFRVTVGARNVSRHEVTSRVGHRMTPEADAKFLALLQCPLFLPVTFKPGESKEFVSEYLLLGDTPPRVNALEVMYTFASPPGDGSLR
jgi:hypothetical protein